MNFDKDDTFLARWLNNDLSDKERKEFEASKEFPYYKKLVEASDQIIPAEFNEALMLERIIASTRQKSSKKQPLWYGIAAAVVLLIGFFVVFKFTSDAPVIILSQHGEKIEVNLPDGSLASLNANSKISYKEQDWDEARNLKLKGEAFFDVIKGSSFIVETDYGDVRVLGTQFNVIAGIDYFEVTCYEGSVAVKSGDRSDTITPGEIWRKVGSKPIIRLTTKTTNPTWMRGESSFDGVPLRIVLAAIEDQYNITFTGKIDKNEMAFTGTFPHDDLDISLQVVLGSLQIDYQFEGENTINLLN